MTGDTAARATFVVERVERGYVLIADRDGPVSVTNDAEAVCRALHAAFGSRRYYYRDTDGQVDELVHEAGRFVEFRPGGPDAV